MKTPPPPSPSSPGDSSLEQLLRTCTAQAPLRDDGFTARVLTALPPVKPRLRVAPFFSRRTLLCLAGTIAGICLARPDFGALSAHLINAPAFLETLVVRQTEFWSQPTTIYNLLILLAAGGLLYWLERTSPDQA